MRITRRQLRKLIEEELPVALYEAIDINAYKKWLKSSDPEVRRAASNALHLAGAGQTLVIDRPRRYWIPNAPLGTIRPSGTVIQYSEKDNLAGQPLPPNVWCCDSLEVPYKDLLKKFASWLQTNYSVTHVEDTELATDVGFFADDEVATPGFHPEEGKLYTLEEWIDILGDDAPGEYAIFGHFGA